MRNDQPKMIGYVWHRWRKPKQMHRIMSSFLNVRDSDARLINTYK